MAIAAIEGDNVAAIRKLINKYQEEKDAHETELKQIEQNFPPVVPDSFALLGFAEIDKNDDTGLL